MRTITLNEAKPEMITVSDLVTAHGQIIAKRGDVLTESLIAKLRFYGISEVQITEDPAEITAQPAPAPVAVPEPVVIENDASSYVARTRKSPEFIQFQDTYKRNLDLLEKTYTDIKNEQFSNLDFDLLLANITTLIQKKTTLDLLNSIHTLEGVDNIYASNINVALISRGLGRWLKFPKESLDTATLAGLFHDIGKTAVPPEILNKTGKLTSDEFDMMKRHTLFGQRMLKKIPGISSAIVNAAGQHHEKYDGTGYPMGLMGDEIDPYASLVAIADVYEAMTALRPHRKPLSPFQVIEAFEADGLQTYDPKYILTFLRNIASAYQNRMVMLTDGRKARIIYLNSGKLSHPIVEFEDKSTVDLSRATDLHICEVL